MTAHDTATALLDAAEVAFATRGVEGASLRQIMRAAEANPAAVHYHYGSREALARAVLDRVLRPLNERRLALLDAAEESAGESSPTIEALLDALVRPDFEAMAAAGRRSPDAVGLAAEIYLRPTRFVTDLVEAHFRPVARRFAPAMVAALPGLAFPELSWRVRWCVFPMVGALLSGEGGESARDGLEAAVARVVAVAAGALRAPATSMNEE